MVSNPPYGERISTPDLLGTYKMIGERLKHQFTGNEAWILSYREECFAQIGLKPSIKIPLFNGSLECEFRKYQMFDGRMREFREEGGVVKTEAEKRRFKQNREFKKRLDEQEENAEADIRSFKFRSLEKKEPKKAREPRDNRESRDTRFSRESRHSRDSRGPRDFKKPFKKKNNRRFNDDED